jgi:hypothetical protein
MKRYILVTVVGAVLAGCGTPNNAPITDASSTFKVEKATNPTPTARPTFPETEYAALSKAGAAVVSGQAFLKTRGGDVKVGAGNSIYLHPVTSYSTFERLHIGDPGGLAPYDPRVINYMRETIADATGRFTFKKVPDGEYYLAGKIKWEVPHISRYGSYMETQGGWIWKTVAVKNGEPVEVMLTE